MRVRARNLAQYCVVLVNTELLSILVYELNSSGDLVSLFHLFSIDERNTVNDLGEVREAA